MWLSAVVVVAPAAAIGPATARADPQPPAINQNDRRFLARLARRTCEQFLLDRSTYTAPYVPANLERLRCDMVVTLRRDRRPIGVGSAGPAPVAQTTIQAALAALRAADKKSRLPRDDADLTIEMEAVGAEERVPLQLDPPDLDAIARRFEPGLDGCTLRRDTVVRRVCPSEFALKNLTVADAFKSLAETVGPPRRAQSLWRFRTHHWYQPGPDRDIVDLRRGMTRVTPESVTPSNIDQAIDRAIQQLLARQDPTGRFAYEYEPAASAYSPKDDPVHQAGAAWALARRTRDDATGPLRVAAEQALEAHRSRIRDLPGIHGAACVVSADNRNKLGLSAQVLLALFAHPDTPRYARDRERLTEGILWLQRPDGRFITAFPPSRRLTGLDIYPAQALIALIEHYRDAPSDRVLQAFNKARDFYENRFERRPTLDAAAWLAQPFAEMARLTHRTDYLRFACRLADWLIDHQLTPADETWPELHGGFRTPDRPTPGQDAAVALAALVDASQTARRFGDSDRAARYADAARLAARFVLQLQVQPEETYAMPFPEKAVGAVRTSVADNRLRLDGLQYALLALSDYRRSLDPADP